MKPLLLVDFYKTISFGHLWHKAHSPLREDIQNLVFDNNLQTGIGNLWMRGK